jgi:2-dehydropantoate 2-reductase
MGTGAVGGFVGGQLAAAGVPVTLIGRPRMLQAIAQSGLTLTDLDGQCRHVPADPLTLLQAPPADAPPPALVLLTVKSGATAEAAASLARVLPPGTPVLSLQNGVANARQAQQAAPGLRVLPGMVPFNVAELAPAHLHRGTSGALAAQDDPVLRPWLPAFARAGLPFQLHADLAPVQWGKLLLNLNNPVNALSGLPLRAQLLSRGYRRCHAALMDEALAALRAAGIAPAPLAGVPPRWMPALLRLPTPLFRRIAARSLQIDDKARSSMADDVALGRRTEVDALCGEVVRLARQHGLQAPRNAAMVQLLDGAWPQPATTLEARALQAALGLRGAVA